jgi:hypothetical protein
MTTVLMLLQQGLDTRAGATSAQRTRGWTLLGIAVLLLFSSSRHIENALVVAARPNSS